MAIQRGSTDRRRRGGTRLKLPRADLDAEDEIVLATRIEAGLLAAEARATGALTTPEGEPVSIEELITLEWIGRRATRSFVECNLRLVAMVSNREALRSGLSESDVFQEGCLGLLEAVRRFDHRRGLRFATYALHWIRAYVVALTATRDGEVNLPVGRAAARRELRGAHASLSQQLGREATATELSVRLGREPNEVRRLLEYAPDELLDPATLADLQAVDERVEREYDIVLRQLGRSGRLLRLLSGESRLVIEWRFGFVDGAEHSISDIARRLGLSRSRVRRHERHALERLRAGCPQAEIANLR